MVAASMIEPQKRQIAQAEIDKSKYFEKTGPLNEGLFYLMKPE